ncbi:hypothetical protein FF1_034011 [Malus domestica]
MKPPLGLKLLLVFSSMVLMLYKCQAGATNLHPLILIPGNGGNQLEARLTTDYKPSVSDDYHNAPGSRLGSLTLVPLSHFSTLILVSRTDNYGVTTGFRAPYQLRSCHC